MDSRAETHHQSSACSIERAEQNNFDQIVVGSNIPGGTNNQNGRFEFQPTGHPQTTGVAIGNAALGYFNSYGEIGRRAYTLLRGNAFEGFVQDNWRVLPGLTLELGLRYSYFAPWYANGTTSRTSTSGIYDLAKRAEVHPTGGYIVSGDPYNGIVLPGSGFPVIGAWPHSRGRRAWSGAAVPRIAARIGEQLSLRVRAALRVRLSGGQQDRAARRIRRL